MRVLEKLQYYGLRNFDITGGLALDTHRLALEQSAPARPLNDIDLLVTDFAAVPVGLGTGFLANHVHPEAPAGKLVVQLVDADDALRIDIFSAYGSTRTRSMILDSPFGAISTVSIEDLASRAASLLMDLARGERIARKHAVDFVWLAEKVDPDRIGLAWTDHRRPNDPPSFQAARQRISELVRLHPELLVTPEYSKDVHSVCPKCRETGGWHRAPGWRIMSILGHV